MRLLYGLDVDRVLAGECGAVGVALEKSLTNHS